MVLMVLLAAALVAVFAILADGGIALGQQGGAQEATDAAAEAGAFRLRARDAEDSRLGAAVLARMTEVAARAGVSIVRAEYTDARGVRLGVPVGGDGASIPPRAAGVHLVGTKRISLLLGSLLGFSPIEVSTRATATVSGVASP